MKNRKTRQDHLYRELAVEGALKGRSLRRSGNNVSIDLSLSDAC